MNIYAEIRLRKVNSGYFKTFDQFTPDQWRVHFEKIIKRTLAKNGWQLEEVKVEA